MKKYLIAAAAALVVFAVAAFAASLDVEGSVLQAGQDRDLTCTESAVVDWQTQTVGNGEFAVNQITVTFGDSGCDGKWAYVAVFSSVGPPGGSTQTGFGIRPIVGDTAVFPVNESDPRAEVDEINAVSVAVKNTDDSGVGCFASMMMDPCT